MLIREHMTLTDWDTVKTERSQVPEVGVHEKVNARKVTCVDFTAELHLQVVSNSGYQGLGEEKQSRHWPNGSKFHIKGMNFRGQQCNACTCTHSVRVI